LPYTFVHNRLPGSSLFGHLLLLLASLYNIGLVRTPNLLIDSRFVGCVVYFKGTVYLSQRGKVLDRLTIVGGYGVLYPGVKLRSGSADRCVLGQVGLVFRLVIVPEGLAELGKLRRALRDTFYRGLLLRGRGVSGQRQGRDVPRVRSSLGVESGAEAWPYRLRWHLLGCAGVDVLLDVGARCRGTEGVGPLRLVLRPVVLDAGAGIAGCLSGFHNGGPSRWNVGRGGLQGSATAGFGVAPVERWLQG
jgi:hypothetical protein